MAAARTGSTSGAASAAANATIPKATKIAAPYQRRRPASRPATAAMATAAPTTRTLRTGLSFVPKRSTKTSFAPGGWRLITSVPTAITSDGAPATSPANSSEPAIASAPAAAPATASAVARTSRVCRVDSDGRVGS